MMRVCCRCFLFPVSHRIQLSVSVCTMTLCVVFAECTLDAQPLNLNRAFHEESLCQVLPGEQLPRLIVLTQLYVFISFFSSSLVCG